MTTMGEVERRTETAQRMKALGHTYDDIAAAIGIRSRTLVHYYLNREERREKNRENWRKGAAARDSQFVPRGTYGEDNCDVTKFKPENAKQSRMWVELLAGAR